MRLVLASLRRSLSLLLRLEEPNERLRRMAPLDRLSGGGVAGMGFRLSSFVFFALAHSLCDSEFLAECAACVTT